MSAKHFLIFTAAFCLFADFGRAASEAIAVSPIPCIEELVTLGRAHSFDENRLDPRTLRMPVYKKTRSGDKINYPDLVAEAVPELESVRYYSRQGAVPQDAEVVLVLLHGMGHPLFSHSGSLLDPLRVFNNRFRHGQGLAQNLMKLPFYTRVAAQAIDQPGAGGGPSIDEYGDLPNYIGWLSRYARYIRHHDLQNRNIPIVFLGRSAAPALMVEMNRQEPIDGIIGMSAAYPSLKHIQKATETILKEEAEGANIGDTIGRMILDHHILNVIDNISLQIDWPHGFNPFNQTKSLLMFGARDAEVTKEEIGDWGRFQTLYPNQIFIKTFENGGHDLFAINDGKYKDDGRFVPRQRKRNSTAYSQTSFEVYSTVFKFLRDIADEKKAMTPESFHR